MISRLTLEDAEARLLVSLSYLVWIIPLLAFVELIFAYITGDTSFWSSSPLLAILQTLLYVVVILKIINVIDNQITAYYKYLAEQEKKKLKTRIKSF